MSLKVKLIIKTTSPMQLLNIITKQAWMVINKIYTNIEYDNDILT